MRVTPRVLLAAMGGVAVFLLPMFTAMYFDFNPRFGVTYPMITIGVIVYFAIIIAIALRYIDFNPQKGSDDDS